MSVSPPGARRRCSPRMGSERGATRMVEGRKWSIVFGIRWDGGKRPRPIVPAALAALAVAIFPSPAQARTVFVVPAPGRSADARALVSRLGGDAGRRIAIAHGFVARVPAGRIATLRRSGAVRSAAPDAALHVSGDDAKDPKDPKDASPDERAAASSAIFRGASGAQPLLDGGITGSGVAIALVDTGVQTVPGLDDGSVVQGPDFSSDAFDRNLRRSDAFGHGTHLAGVMVGDDPASGFSGVAPGAKLLSVKVANSAGTTSLLRVLAALDWIRRHREVRGARVGVVNLSLGVDAGDASYVRDPLAFAAESLWRSGIVVGAAAGNNADDHPQLDLPAADPFAVAVGALDTNGTADPTDDAVADFSSRSRRRSPDVVAPGTGIVSFRVPGSELDREFDAARVGDRWFRGSGTSQATAVVSAATALLLSARPNLTPDQVKALLESGAEDVAVPGATGLDVSAAAGSGRVDAARSLALPTPGSSAVQRFTNAMLGLGDGDVQMGPGASQWAGRRWSGRRWSAKLWEGRRWSGEAWVADDGSKD